MIKSNIWGELLDLFLFEYLVDVILCLLSFSCFCFYSKMVEMKFFLFSEIGKKNQMKMTLKTICESSSFLENIKN